tara:strand:- start:5257 stop:5574 length:318 start_codon:yes stop_codon:yes gene_type:complete
MIDTDKYPSGPDDERLMTLSNRELRLAVWAYGSELRNMKEDSTHTDAYTLEEVKRLRRKIALLDILEDRDGALDREILNAKGIFREHELKGIYPEEMLLDYDYWR